jgi:hypothetical protein
MLCRVDLLLCGICERKITNPKLQTQNHSWCKFTERKTPRVDSTIVKQEN